MIFSTFVAGICASIGLALATYAFVQTPQVQDVPVYADNGILRSESKFLYLFWPVLVQIILLCASAIHSHRWQSFKNGILESVANFNAQHPLSRSVDAQRLHRIICYAIMGFEVLILALIVHHVILIFKL
jgi:hypothetical protein